MTPLKQICFLLILAYCSATENRLSENVVPKFYNISLTLDPKNDDYSGTVEITFQAFGELIVDENDTSIVVGSLPPSKDIYIHNDGDFIELSSVLLNDEIECTVESPNETHISKLSCSSNPDADNLNTLLIEFTSKFSKEDGFGLVKTTYNDGKNDQIIIESNFKPVYARRAFPCLDEPDLKAGFSLTITHPSDYTVLSNSVIESTTDDETRVTKFEDTPEISPHLLSIFISKFKGAETDPEENLDFKIFTRKEVSNLTKAVANEYYHKIIEKLDLFTGVSYENLSDIESYFVAIPDYSDAMGDFGLFAYKETDLLDEGEKTTNIVKQNIISTMAYKLSHEWYGGDVALKWWSDAWANEAVATYLKYIIPDEVDSELEMSNQFLLEVNQKMLRYDGYRFAQPLSSKDNETNNEWIIGNKLVSLNYEKGASLLHMINLVLGGKEKFQSALKSHWENRYDTNGTDILKDLVSGINEDVDYYTYLEKWAFSSGFPLITVQLNDANDTDSINILQKRFVYPSEALEAEDDSEWYVPLSAGSKGTLSNIHISQFLNPEKDMSFYFNHDSWIVINTQGGCFYRVNYDEILWRRILDGLSNNREDFPALQRAQLIDDIFNVARTGDVSYDLAFEMADLLVDETEYYPWYSALGAFSYLLEKLKDKDDELSLKEYILGLMEKALVIPTANFIEAEDKHVDVLKKVMLLKWACYLGHEACIAFATEKFESYKKSPTSLEDYNARGVIFCNALRYSENIKDDWNFLWDQYSTSTSVHQQNDILNALGCAEDKSILTSYLQKVITDNSGIKKQDVLVVFNSVLSSSLGLEVATDFLENNFSEIQDFFKNMRILSEMVHALAEKLISDDHVDWLNNLLKDDTLDDYEDVRTKANALAAVNNYWQKNFEADVANIIRKDSSTSTESTTTDELPTTTPSSSTNSESTTSPNEDTTTTEIPTTSPDEDTTTTEIPTTSSPEEGTTTTEIPTTSPEEGSSSTEIPTTSSPEEGSSSTEIPTTTAPGKSETLSLSKYVFILLVILSVMV